MRIAIITLPIRQNYGGILQNYALQVVLKGMGYEVETISLPKQAKLSNWVRPLVYGKRILKKFLFRSDCRIFYEEWNNKRQDCMLRNMDAFIAQYISTREVRSFSELRERDYDCIVVGSDQIWRPMYSYNPVDLVYLSFAKQWKNVKRIAYAVSFGTDHWEYTVEQTQKCKDLIPLFSGISVRESSGVDLCRKYLGVNALHVLDPTLLLSVEDYIHLFENAVVHHPKGELLTCILDENQEKTDIIEAISLHFQYRSYRANSQYEDDTAPIDKRVQPPVEQWLKDFYEAKFVVTDSFHATVFSILFGKPFIVICNQFRGAARITSLLRIFELENHIFYSVSDLEKVDWDHLMIEKDKIRSILQDWRDKSMQFLNNSLLVKGN